MYMCRTLHAGLPRRLKKKSRIDDTLQQTKFLQHHVADGVPAAVAHNLHAGDFYRSFTRLLDFRLERVKHAVPYVAAGAVRDRA